MANVRSLVETAVIIRDERNIYVPTLCDRGINKKQFRMRFNRLGLFEDKYDYI